MNTDSLLTILFALLSSGLSVTATKLAAIATH